MVELTPLEVKNITISVNATYAEWPTSALTEEFTLKASTTIAGQSVETSIKYNLKLCSDEICNGIDDDCEITDSTCIINDTFEVVLSVTPEKRFASL